MAHGKDSKVTFRRIRGRIIPIRSSHGGIPKGGPKKRKPVNLVKRGVESGVGFGVFSEVVSAATNPLRREFFRKAPAVALTALGLGAFGKAIQFGAIGLGVGIGASLLQKPKRKKSK